MFEKSWREIKNGVFMNFCEGDDDKKGGAGGGDKAPDLAAENAALKAQIEALKAAGTKGPPDKKEDGEKDLVDRVREKADAELKDTNKNKRLADAIRFDMTVDTFLKSNEAILPADIGTIFKAANEERYSDPVEKDGVLRSALIKSFFQIEKNVALLTPGQKTALDRYNELTKNGKLEQAQNIYEMVFEPALEALKNVKKAEALSKSGAASGGSEEGFHARMIEMSRKKYLRGKA